MIKNIESNHGLALTKIIFLAVAGLVVLAVVIAFGKSLSVLAHEREYRRDILEAPAPYLEELRDRETKILTSYGVVDSAAQRYHIPIDLAMEQLAARATQ